MFRFLVPPSPLKFFINGIWYHNATVTYNAEKILPTGTIELIINLGSPTNILSEKDHSITRVSKDYWICGMHNEFIINAPIAETHMIGVSFKPFGAASFFNMPISEFTNSLVDLDLIWGNEIKTLKDSLLSVATVDERIRIVCAFLEKKFRPEESRSLLMSEMTAFVRNSSGRITDLYDKCGFSKKHLTHLFKQNVGVTPKGMSRIFRFNRLLLEIDPEVPINWASLAIECDYFDQAHFIKDFKAFTGLSPIEYLNNRKQLLEVSPKKGQDVNFVPIS